MQLKLIFPTGHIIVALKQHPTIEKWFEFFKQKTDQQPDYYRMFFSDESRGVTGPGAPDHTKHWKIIHDSIKIMKDIGYKIPFEIPAEFDFDQKTLNTLHRFFTYNCEWWYKQAIEPNPFDPNFHPPEDWDFPRWYSVIGQINEAVHNLEINVLTDTKKMYQPKTDEWILPSFIINSPASITGELIKTCYLPFDSYDQSFNYEPMDFSKGPAVTLNASILGKCMLQSYFEEDDPTARDARGREGSYGGFCIHLTNRRQEIYRSDHFRQWAAKYGCAVESLPLEFQIGYVSESSWANLFDVDPNRYIRTEFIR